MKKAMLLTMAFCSFILIGGCDQSDSEKRIYGVSRIHLESMEYARHETVITYGEAKITVEKTWVASDITCCDGNELVTLELDDAGYAIKKNSSQLPDDYHTTYVYDDNHLITQINNFARGSLTDSYVIEYNTHSQATRATLYYRAYIDSLNTWGGPLLTAYYSTFDYKDENAKNPFRGKGYQNGTLASETQYEFDNNPNPCGKLAIALKYNFWVSNIIVSQVPGTGIWYRQMITYNGLGYPEGIKRSWSAGNPTEVVTYTYSYH